MNNSLRSIGFALSLMGSISAMMFLTPMISDELLVSYTHLYFFMYLVFFALIQSLFRWYITKKYETADSPLFILNLSLKRNQDRLYYYLFLFLFIIPKLRNLSTSNYNSSWIVQLLTTVIIIEAFLYVSYKSLRGIFSQSGIVIKGFDPRIDIPLGTPIQSHSGFYRYNDFSHYTFNSEKIELFLHNNQGKVTFRIQLELHRPLTGLLQSKGIKML